MSNEAMGSTTQPSIPPGLVNE